MKSQVLHTVWCYISGEAAGEISYWSLLGMKGLTSGLGIFNDLRVGICANRGKARNHSGWLLNTARSVWDAFRGVIWRAYTTLTRIIRHCSRNCANLKYRCLSQTLPQKFNPIHWLNLLPIVEIQYALGQRFSNDLVAQHSLLVWQF